MCQFPRLSPQDLKTRLMVQQYNNLWTLAVAQTKNLYGYGSGYSGLMDQQSLSIRPLRLVKSSQQLLPPHPRRDL